MTRKDSPLQCSRVTSENMPEVEPPVSEDMEDPLFTFGVIADIQYADIDDGYNFTKTRMRFYRNSLSLLQGAMRGWAAEAPHFILQLGDIIDGYNVTYKSTEASLEKVLAEMGRLKTPVHHIWGNHEFYNFSRKQLMESGLNSSALPGTSAASPEHGADPLDSFYAYHFSPYPKFRLLLIDSYDFSVIGRDPSSDKYARSSKLLRQKNPNEDKNSPTGLADTRFVQFNGGISADQLGWIDGVLQAADNNNEKVIVAGHLPVHPASTDPVCLTWNYAEVLAVLQSHPCVVAYFSGHDHDGGYFQDQCGIHHVTFSGVIETPPDSQAYGTMYICADKMVLRGRGLIPHRTLLYRAT